MHVIFPSYEEQARDSSKHARSTAGFSRHIILEEHAESFPEYSL